MHFSSIKDLGEGYIDIHSLSPHDFKGLLRKSDCGKQID